MGICTGGIKYLWQVGFTKEQSVPANFYIGWCEEAEDAIADNADLADLTELSGNGYSRQAVASGAVDLTAAAYGTNGYKVTTKDVTFTASGGAWNLAKTRFLATSPDDSGELLVKEPLNSGSGVALADGESYDCNMTLQSEP